jgi:hypothetical protein
MEHFLRDPLLPMARLQAKVIIMSLGAYRTSIKSRKWASVCDTGIDTYVMYQRFNISYLRNQRLDLIVS